MFVVSVSLQDGRNWARIEADHHTGALFDVSGVAAGVVGGDSQLLFNGRMQVDLLVVRRAT